MFIALLLFLFVAGLLIDAFFLHLTTKFLKIENTSYKKAIIVIILELIFSIIASIAVSLVLSAFIPLNVEKIIALIASAIILHKLLIKYYQTNLKTNIKIFIIWVIITVILSLLIIIPIRTFVMQPFYIKGAAMEPNFNNNDYTIFKLYDKDYQRKEVVIFKYPAKQEEYFVKRIIGLPGEKIQIKNGGVYLYNASNPNGVKLDEPYLAAETKTYSLNDNILELKANEYYVLGDNRATSKDSSSFGPVNKNLILGKYWFTPLKNK